MRIRSRPHRSTRRERECGNRYRGEGPSTVGWLPEHFIFNDTADDMGDRNVPFLDPLGVIGRNDDRYIDETLRSAPAFPKKPDDSHAPFLRLGDRPIDIFGLSARADRDEHITACPEGFDLPGKNIL